MTAKPKRLLMLSVSAGAGHMRAAEALRVVAESEFGMEAAHIDVMDHVSSRFRALYTDFYLKLVNRYPHVWAMLYRIADRTKPSAPSQRLRRLIERLNTRDLRGAIARFKPDAIVCTHFLPAELLMREIEHGRIDCPVYVQVTDFDLHALWVVPHMAGYFAASDEVAFRMRARGLDATRVHVTGIPIMPTFSNPPTREVAAAELGLDPKRTTILLMGGGAGIGGLEDVAARLLALDPDFQLIALAGKNAATLAALQKLAANERGRLFAVGYTDRVERMMAASDFAITKPGGLTTSECLAVGLPMIVNSPIPGQEERNCDYLLEQGAALKALDAPALEYRVRELLANPVLVKTLREKAGAIRRADSATRVVSVIVTDLQTAKRNT